MSEAPVRHFTVATFVVCEGRVLLLLHAKLGLWLPPGGHVELNELPDDAAIREVWEEAGVRVALVGERGLGVDYPTPLVRPFGIQVERIGANADYHEHIDLIYFARSLDGLIAPRGNGEGERVGWYAVTDLRSLGVVEEVALWSERAAAVVSECEAQRLL